MNHFLNDLKQAVRQGRVAADEPMNKHTTFRTGGPARYFVSPADEDELRDTISLCREKEVPYYILGNGSNLLVCDSGYDGVMIDMGGGFCGIRADTETDTLTAGAGALLSGIAREALIYSLGGFEFAAGIPGSLGGAIVMNAGAYDGEMKQVLRTVRVMAENGAIEVLDAEKLELGYRHSCIPKRGYIVLSAQLRLKPADKAAIRSRMDDLAARRKEKQPLEYPSAGSTFKRPGGYFAGKLIEDAGLRGFCVGGAQVSEKHCGFIINREGATAEDIRTLCSNVQDKVKETSGVDLETEVKMLGWK